MAGPQEGTQMMEYEVASYGTHELRQTIRDDPWAVRDEAAKRHNAIAKKVAAAKARIAKMESEMTEIGTVFEAALKEIAAI
jgi:hypothetical protein